MAGRRPIAGQTLDTKKLSTFAVKLSRSANPSFHAPTIFLDSASASEMTPAGSGHVCLLVHHFPSSGGCQH